MVADLSLQHTLVCNLFVRPTTQVEWNQYRLSDEQVAFYHEHGYLCGVKMFDDRQIEQLRSELNSLFDKQHRAIISFTNTTPTNRPLPTRCCFMRSARGGSRPGFTIFSGIRRSWCRVAVARRRGAVLARSTVLQATSSRRSRRLAPGLFVLDTYQADGHLTCWIGLDDSTVDNGCLQYVPGSHRWPLLPITAWQAVWTRFVKCFRPSRSHSSINAYQSKCRAGHGSFHHPLMVHGSYENRTDRPRRAVVINVFRDGTLSDSNDVLLAVCRRLRKGNACRGNSSRCCTIRPWVKPKR